MALPVLVLCGILNVLNVASARPLGQLENLPALLSIVLLFALLVGLLLVTRRFYRRLPDMINWLFLLVMVPATYLVASLCQHGIDASRNPQDFEHLFNDVDFVLVVPILLVALLLLGWAFDNVKNRIS
ncbi:hypothetical protein [Hymenobacter rubripertinctus]|nr:hypothetical protein [Hymenobacter rubripertinctus]